MNNKVEDGISMRSFRWIDMIRLLKTKLWKEYFKIKLFWFRLQLLRLIHNNSYYKIYYVE